MDKYIEKYALHLMKQSEGRGSIYQRLYREIVKRPSEMERVFKKQWYKCIPLKTVNFANFISVCYFSKNEISMLDRETKSMFITWLKEIEDCADEYMATIGAIITIIGKDENEY